MEKPSQPASPIHPLARRRWSPTVFDDRAISAKHLASVFEAARWSASCFNEQPWGFVLASRHAHPEDFARLLACLIPSNAVWAKHAPLLGFSVAKLNFDKTGAANRYAWYDSGQAAAHLSLEAVEHGIFVHQMAGFDAAQAKAALQVPDTHEVVCAIALGYGAEGSAVPAEFKAREDSPRVRKPVEDFLHWGRF